MTTCAVVACLVALAPLTVAFAPPQLFFAGGITLVSSPLAAYNTKGDSVPDPVSIPGLMRPVPGVDFTPRAVASDMTQYAVDQLTLNRVTTAARRARRFLLRRKWGLLSLPASVPRIIHREIKAASASSTAGRGSLGLFLFFFQVRDCAVTNKEELMKIMRGPEMFTRSGR
jgi:hypothetical protein